ncbi:MAG: hypothetical protein A2076_10800 [Geobacteraceae bacterium GWC2_53_11]|nr:MAG: hypothetical protein A2076_10800 [Geobacteraceae bacterium GWC2_53_11]
MKRTLIVFCLTAIALLVPLSVFAADKGADAPMKAAIFIQNRAGADFTDKLDVLNDLLTTRLTEKGFSVIDRSVVMAKFREARDLDPALQREVTALEKAMDGANAQAGPESSLSGASALRIAQMTGADYLVMASLTSFGQETRTFKGEGTQYGSNNRSSVYTLRIAVKVLEGNQGGTVYGDTVAIAERVAVVEGLRIESSEIINKLLDAGALKIADNIGDKTGKIRDARVPVAAGVEFSVKSNVEGATVELDGAAIGSTPGRFIAPPGVHQLRVYKQWLAPWDKTVNIYAGQVLNISLELSKEGLKRYSTLENLKHDLAKTKMQTDAEGKERDANIEINKQQSDADAYSKKAIADGEKKKREDSYDRIEGAPGTVIYK